MEKMWFRGYGFLEWLEPEEYWKDSWEYHRIAYGSDEQEYDIVELNGDYRYTNV